MKKLLFASFVGALTLTACSKKADNTESNTMLAEPDTANVLMDSTSTKQPAMTVSKTEVLPVKQDSAIKK